MKQEGLYEQNNALKKRFSSVSAWQIYVRTNEKQKLQGSRIDEVLTNRKQENCMESECFHNYNNISCINSSLLRTRFMMWKSLWYLLKDVSSIVMEIFFFFKDSYGYFMKLLFVFCWEIMLRLIYALAWKSCDAQ